MKIITQGQLDGLLDRLIADYVLIAPREVEGVVLYAPVEKSEDIAWNAPRPAMSIKNAVFPATEQLMMAECIGGSSRVRVFETKSEGEQILFGVRPCDAHGIAVLDELFLNTEPVDPYYAQRRAHTTVIGLACKEMSPTCFCTSVGGGPTDASHVDLLLTEFEGGYAVEIATSRGEAILSEAHLTQSEVALPEPIQNPPIQVAKSEFWPGWFEDGYWEELAERCLSCRICAYVCPTCRCFDVRDEPMGSSSRIEQFERLRCWDSCTREEYRRTAGGHDPRSDKGQRLRNRLYCKFFYFPQQNGMIACTGCGRCIDSCPVNIDLTEVLSHWMERVG